MGHCVKQKRFNVDNIFDMKGIGFGGIRFQQKLGFTLRIKKSLRHPFRGHFALKEQVHIENIFHKGVHFGGIVSNKKGSMLTTSLT